MSCWVTAGSPATLPADLAVFDIAELATHRQRRRVVEERSRCNLIGTKVIEQRYADRLPHQRPDAATVVGPAEPGARRTGAGHEEVAGMKYRPAFWVEFMQGFVFGVVAEEKQYGSVLVLTDDSSATLWTGQPNRADGGLMGRPPSLPASWQHSRGARSQHRAALLVTPRHPDR
jgi:hypothetical protein